MLLSWISELIRSLAQWPLSGDRSTAFQPFSLNENWSVLGPFQIGTREAVWGADPLELYGGFHTLSADNDLFFASSLAFNGTVAWSHTKASVEYLPSRDVIATLSISFPDIDWSLLQQVYGWSALQWQGWVRGKLDVTSDEPVTICLHLTSVLEYWVDDQHVFGGDFYGFHRAPRVLRLAPGDHTIELRLVRDVRAMGGITNDPSVEVVVHISATYPSLRHGGEALLPDRLDTELGPTSSTFASVVLRNDDIEEVYIDSVEATHDQCETRLTSPTPIKLVPGQSRPIAFQLACIPGTSSSVSIRLFFNYHLASPDSKSQLLFVWALPRRPQPSTEPHLVTYQHPSGIISYAILKPPTVNMCAQNQSLPVLLLLHGAGIEADDDQVKHSVDDLPPLCAWTLFPSGVTSWSGDDWHDWGWGDVQAAIRSIPTWIEQVDWQGPGVDVDRWVVSGHSNGGQGAWHAVTHYPDNVIAVAPISAYASIETYVPYSWWQVSDPRRHAIIHAATSSHRHELLLQNAAGIPILLQHGSADDNVPAYHARSMHQRLQSLSIRSTLVELEGRSHWWDGVMTTRSMSQFLSKYLSEKTILKAQHRMHNFTLVTTNPGNTGSKQGFTITDLTMPSQLGSITCHVDLDGHCDLETLNVRSFTVSHRATAACKSMTIDGNMMSTDSSFEVFRLDKEAGWSARSSFSHCLRTPSQQGGLEAILRTRGAFQIVQHSAGTDQFALQIASNMLQYFSADAELAATYLDALGSTGSVISIAIGNDLPLSHLACNLKCALKTGHDRITLSTTHSEHVYHESINGLAAAVFLRPLPDDRLELVVWAIDTQHLSLAARLVPMMTGGGLPDFVLVSSRMADRGIGGVIAMGFFDGDWCATSNSFFEDGDA